MSLEKDTINMLESLKDDTPHEAHVDADAILIQFLRDIGYEDVADAWERLEENVGGFWYS